MGCGCGKNNSIGMNRSNPLVFGEDTPDQPAQRMIVVQATGGVPAGQRRWVRGSEVESMVESGALRTVR